MSRSSVRREKRTFFSRNIGSSNYITPLNFSTGWETYNAAKKFNHDDPNIKDLYYSMKYSIFQREMAVGLEGRLLLLDNRNPRAHATVLLHEMREASWVCSSS